MIAIAVIISQELVSGEEILSICSICWACVLNQTVLLATSCVFVGCFKREPRHINSDRVFLSSMFILYECLQYTIMRGCHFIMRRVLEIPRARKLQWFSVI